jgi:hypothetical protein
MLFDDIPESAVFLDVDGIPVARVEGGLVAFDLRDGSSYPYPDASKAGMEGDVLSRTEFSEWLRTGRNKFDVG